MKTIDNREIEDSLAFTAKRQKSDSRLRLLKINDKFTKIAQNNSHVYGY